MKNILKSVSAVLLIVAIIGLSACSSKPAESSSVPAKDTAEKIVYDLKKFDKYKDDFVYAYSPITKSFGEFKQDEDGLSNYRNDELIVNAAEGVEVPDYFPVNPDEFAWISLLTKEKYSAGTKATLHCSFDKMGAPLIAFTDALNKDEAGHNIYGLYFEVVAYNDGCNVWEIRPSVEEKEWGIDPTLVAEPKFHIDDKAPVEIIVEFKEKEIVATVNGNTSSVKLDNMPEDYHIGFVSCEGINHFYDFTIETK